MKYLIIGDGNSPHMLKWAKELKKTFDLYLFSYNKVSNDLLNLLGDKRVISAGFSLSSTGGNFSILKALSLLNGVVRYVNPQIVNPHYITSNGFITVLLKKLHGYDYKIVASCWGSDILVTPNKNFMYKSITKYILKNSDMITSDSYFMSDKIRELCGKEPLTFPFGVEEIPNDSQKEPFLFYSNRMLKKNYNIEKLVEFFGVIHKQIPSSKLIIANDGPLRELILRKIYELHLGDAVDYVGYISQNEQRKIYSKSTFYISIPDSDATSVSLLEAMSYGCIPIVSNIAANREWVMDGYNGLYFDGNPNKVIDIVKRSGEIAKINKDIISARAIWSNNIKNFIKVIYEFRLS
ncbi:MAG: glycosyltransferase family 4 protein [Calditerrivibrio sp.]|nr:glycosyltransferase family 4 protein [Calditerrivibrio sp.]